MTDDKKPDEKEKRRGKKRPSDKPSRILKRKPAWDRKGRPEQENR